MKAIPYFNEFISDPFISESLNSFLGEPIFEIGTIDQAQKPLSWTKRDSKEAGSTVYVFDLSPSTEYEVVLKKTTLPNLPINIYVEFYANGDRDNVTNEGYPLLVMATVIDIIKDYLQSVPDAVSFSFVPAKADEDDNRRLKLYLRYIRGHFNNPKIKIDHLTRGYVSVTVYL